MNVKEQEHRDFDKMGQDLFEKVEAVNEMIGFERYVIDLKLGGLGIKRDEYHIKTLFPGATLTELMKVLVALEELLDYQFDAQ